MFRETLEAGLGVVLAFLSEKVTLPPLVDDIEALVAVRAISFALDRGFSSIILEEDLETIIKALQNNEESFASYGHLLSSAKSSIDAFSDISYSHICRFRNSITYNLARHAKYVSALYVWMKDVSPHLYIVLMTDYG